MKKPLLLMVGLILIVGSFILLLGQPASGRFNPNLASLPSIQYVIIGDTRVNVEIAYSNAERVKGLSGRDGLNDGTGMLFIFDNAKIQNFWMKDMNFPIDIVWIDSNQTIVGLEKAIPPDSFPQIFPSPTKVMYVLELPANFSDTYSIDTGTRVYFE
ncbi:MAG: DUF192 domain-containing protein [bacterium]